MPIHSLTVLGVNVDIHPSATVGAFCFIDDGVTIGANVVIQGNVRIGKNCNIQEGSVLKWGSVLTQKVDIGKNVFFGTGAKVLGSDSDREEQHGTIIGDNCYIGANTIIHAKASIIDNVTTGSNTIVRTPIMASGTYVGLQRQIK